MNLEDIMKVVPASVLVAIGAVTLAVITALLSIFAKAIIAQVKKSLSESREEMQRQNLEGRREREYDNYLLLRGMQVMGDCEHELIYCVMHGTHNGGLERANKELDDFRRLSNKASKWNLKIDK